MASSVQSSGIYDRCNDTMYYVAQTVTNEYMVAGTTFLSLRDTKKIGMQVVSETNATPVTFGIGVSTASQGSGTNAVYTIVRTAATGAVAQTTNHLEVDVDELAHLGAGFAYAVPFVSSTATNACAVHVTRQAGKRQYDGLTAAATASVAAATGSGT